MQDAPPTKSTRPLLLTLAAIVLATPGLVDLGVTQSRHRRVEEEAARKAREGGELAREALAVQLQAVSMMTDNAVANPRFLAALRGRVDRTTLADLLLDRNLVGAVPGSAGGDLVRRRDDRVLAGGRRRRRARRRDRSSGGEDRQAIGAAARRLRARRSWPPLVRCRSAAGRRTPSCCWRSESTTSAVDGRGPIGPDDAGQRWTARAGTVRDGTARGSRRWCGREASVDVALSDPAEHGAAVPLAPGLWLWTLGRTDFGQTAAAFDRTRRQASWALAIPLALVLLAVALRRPRRQPADADLPAPREPVLSQNLTRLGLSASGGTAPPSAGTDGGATAPPPPSGPTGPGMPLGRYMLVDRIGEGGMAEVFTAVSFGYGGFRRPFVIKRLRAELNGNPTAVGLFIDEANLASTLVHSNIVPVFDFGEAAGSYFLSQEYVIGRDLGQHHAPPARAERAAAVHRRDPAARARGAGRAGVRARQTRRRRQPAGNRPPRHHARERHDLRAGRGEGARLRHHEGDAARVADRERHGEGERRVHVPGAGARQDRRSALGSVLAGPRHPLRGDRRADLPRRDLLRPARRPRRPDRARRSWRASPRSRRRCPRCSGARWNSTRTTVSRAAPSSAPRSRRTSSAPARPSSRTSCTGCSASSSAPSRNGSPRPSRACRARHRTSLPSRSPETAGATAARAASSSASEASPARATRPAAARSATRSRSAARPRRAAAGARTGTPARSSSATSATCRPARRSRRPRRSRPSPDSAPA